MKFTNRAVLLSVLESTIGTDPGSGYTGILVNKGIDIKADAQKTNRDIIRTTFSPMGHVVGAKSYNISCDVELKGGGMSSTSHIVAPEIDTLLQCCAFEKSDCAIVDVSGNSGTWIVGEEVTEGAVAIGYIQDTDITGTTGKIYIRNFTGSLVATDTITGTSSTATATVDAVNTEALCYRPVSDRASMKTITTHFWKDNIQHVATGCRGTVSLDMKVGAFGVFKFNIQGSYATPVDGSQPNPTFSTIVPPVCVNAGLKIGSTTMTGIAVESMSVDIGNDVQPRNDINAVEGRIGYEITGRSPKGSIDPEVANLTDFNPWTIWKDATTSKIYATIGSTAGNIIRVGVPYAVYDDVSYNDRNGIMAYSLPFICTDQVNGDNDFYLIFS